MKKMSFKRKKKHNTIVIITILIFLGVHYTFKLFNSKALPIFIEYSDIETKKIISNVVINLINNEVLNNIDTSSLFNTTSDTKGNIKSIDLDSKYINSILNNTTKLLNIKLNELESSDCVFKLPSGIMFNNNILVNIFPKIPIKLEIIGNVLCVISTKVEPYGINNALFKLNLDITVDVKILLPFTSKKDTITTSVPILIKLIEGNIPGYLLGGYYNNSFSN